MSDILPSRLIDCTYLSAVARCLRGVANHPDDLSSFVRFTGEVLVTQSIYFTADPTGPVYKPALESSHEISTAIGSQNFLRHFNYFDISYPSACKRAASDFARDLSDHHLDLETVGTLSPEFDKTVSTDPDIEYLFCLKAKLENRQQPESGFSVRPGNATRFVLCQQNVLSSLAASNLLTRVNDEATAHKITAAIRSLVYYHVGRELGASYLPATSRAKVIPKVSRPLVPLSMQSTATSLQIDEESLVSVPEAVSAIITLCNGDPRDILAQAWATRETYASVLKLLPISGDALNQPFVYGSSLKTAANELSHLINEGIPHSLIDCLDINFLIFGLPSISLDLAKFRRWIKARYNIRRLKPYADIIWGARPLDRQAAYRALYLKTGLSQQLC